MAANKATASLQKLTEPFTRICSVDGCERKHKAHGWCDVHRTRLERRGTLELTTVMTLPLEARFLAKCVPGEIPMHAMHLGPCINWAAYLDKDGYGQFKMNGVMQQAHRVAYILFVGAIPIGLEIDHLCCNQSCVNYVHLEPVTGFENNFRAAENRRNGIKVGHHYQK